MEKKTFYVWAKWDPEAQVWFTKETSISGLSSSGDSLIHLRDRLLEIIPDFLEADMPANACLHIIADVVADFPAA